MREIKFRGKTGTTEGKKWVYGYLYKIKSFFSEDYQYFIKNEHLQETSVDEDTIGQYTGLKDKNGKEIYEGDIVRTKYMDKTFIVWVEYSDEYAEFVTKCKEILFFDEPLSDIGRADREVIGNIYDNPELLEEDYNV